MGSETVEVLEGGGGGFWISNRSPPLPRLGSLSRKSVNMGHHSSMGCPPTSLGPPVSVAASGLHPRSCGEALSHRDQTFRRLCAQWLYAEDSGNIQRCTLEHVVDVLERMAHVDDLSIPAAASLRGALLTSLALLCACFFLLGKGKSSTGDYWECPSRSPTSHYHARLRGGGRGGINIADFPSEETVPRPGTVSQSVVPVPFGCGSTFPFPSHPLPRSAQLYFFITMAHPLCVAQTSASTSTLCRTLPRYSFRISSRPFTSGL